MPALFHFEVHTPYRLFFSGKVESITLALSDGEIGILANRSPMTAPVVCCILYIKDEQGQLRQAFITDGIIEVTEIKTLIMADAAEWPEEIDTERAIKSKQEAENDSKIATFKFEIDSAKARLRRADYRLRVAATREKDLDADI